ncbi:hypothetical protein M569_07736, partial [Genlisea aurea]
FLFLIAIRSLLLVESQSFCLDNQGKYTANSVYRRNLDSLLASLPPNIGNTGFLNSSAGQDSDRVYAIAFCRADMQLEDCRNCIRNGTKEVLADCPLRRGAILFKEPCLVRFSSESIVGVLAEDRWVAYSNSQSAFNVSQFITTLGSLLDSLRQQAAAAGQLLKVAADNRSGPGFYTIYSLVQCTPDISADDCDKCISYATGQIPPSCPIGYRIELPSCRLYYDVVPYYNVSRIQEVRAQLAPPAPSSPSPATAPAPPDDNDDADEVTITVDYLEYDFGKIRAATDDFSEANELGRGGFGVVYKGRLENGKEIAVKRLHGVSAQAELEFKNEVLLMVKLKHRNLLQIHGFSIQGSERLLIYEFMQNSSLDRFIFDRVKSSQMDWDQRYKIIGGIARGLHYLHEDSRFNVIHRDIKPSNVLLDGGMNPKIADFGVARLFDGNEGSTSRVVGTYGYMAPEYLYHGHLSVKIDVYSFGVLILEIISGQKMSSFVNEEGRSENMLAFAWRNWRDGRAESIVDPVLGDGSRRFASDVLRCVRIGLLCVQANASARPTMASVVMMLSSSSVTMPRPSRPGFFTGGTSEQNESRPIPDVDASRNEISIS